MNKKFEKYIESQGKLIKKRRPLWLNHVELTGYIHKTLKPLTMKSGQRRMGVVLAIPAYYTFVDGIDTPIKTETQYIICNIWGDNIDTFLQGCRKGKLVLVKGKLKPYSYNIPQREYPIRTLTIDVSMFFFVQERIEPGKKVATPHCDYNEDPEYIDISDIRTDHCVDVYSQSGPKKEETL